MGGCQPTLGGPFPSFLLSPFPLPSLSLSPFFPPEAGGGSVVRQLGVLTPLPPEGGVGNSL